MDESQAATALLTEHLQYTPLSLVDDIINSANNILYQGINSLETGLTTTPPERLGFKRSVGENGQPEYPEAKQEIEEGLHQFETLLESAADKKFDVFEIYVLRNILSVPAGLAEWIRLKHYDGLSHPLPEGAPGPDTVELLRKKLAASRKVSMALTAEHSRNEAILTQLRGILTPGSEDQLNLSFLSQSTSFTGQQPLTTNTKFTLSQLPALKSTINDLKSRVANLQNLQSATETAKDEMREERRQYIEQRTRSHIERNGAAASDPGSLAGKQTDTAEVEALERVANMLDPP